MIRSLRLLPPAIVVALVLPAGASAQAVVLGSPLRSAPNVAFGCETRPQPFGGGPGFPGTYGDLVPIASGTPDCTWFLNGVWGAIDARADPRVGTVPGNGTITRIAVRSGPNPAPIRFVVGRNLHTICCFFVAETSPAQPRPNAVSTFRVNLPVERNTNTETHVRTDDFVGVSAVAGAGTLPLAEVGSHNTLNPVPGNPNAGAVYPRLSSGNDQGGGMRPDGNPGFEVLMQVTFCPAGQPCVGPVLRLPVFGPNVFRVAPGATPRIARAKAGSTLRFRLDVAATAKIAIQRSQPGRRSKGKCRKPTPALSGAKACTRWAAAGTLTRRNLAAGKVAIPFTGRIGTKALKPGSYRARITPTEANGAKGRTRTAKFKIVR